MTMKAEFTTAGWLKTAIQFSATMGCAFGISACTGMYAPYPSHPAEGPSKINLIPITPDLVTAARLDKPAPEEGLNIPPGIPGQYRYVIKPGDILEVALSPIVTFSAVNSTNVLGEQGQGNIVHYDGSIYLPFAGVVQVEGLTPRDAQQRVVGALSKYLKTPEVIVSVREFRSQRVLLMGQVNTPGFIPVTDIPLTLIGLLATSGVMVEHKAAHDPNLSTGTTIIAANEVPDLTRVSVKRGGKDYIINAETLAAADDRSQDFILLDGDVVTVPPRKHGKVFLMGEVGRQALVDIDANDTNLATILLSGGGIDPLSSNASRVYVLRGDLKKPTVYQLNAKAPDAFLLAQQFKLEPKDVVFVSAAGITRWNRFLQLLLPAINGIVSSSVVTDIANGRTTNN